MGEKIIIMDIYKSHNDIGPEYLRELFVVIGEDSKCDLTSFSSTEGPDPQTV